MLCTDTTSAVGVGTVEISGAVNREMSIQLNPEKMAAYRANSELEVNGGKQYFPNEFCTLTDETYPTHIIPFLGNGFSIFAPPRTYGVRVGFSWRND